MRDWISISILILLGITLTTSPAVADSATIRPPEQSFYPVTVKYCVERIWDMAGIKNEASTQNRKDYSTLLKLLNDDSPELRRLAAYVLGEIGNKDAVEPLVSRLKDPDAHVRRIAAWALGKIEDSRAVMPLIEVLCCPKETRHVQCAAAYSLGRMGDRRAVRLLDYLKEKETGRLKRQASTSLARIAPDLYMASK